MSALPAEACEFALKHNLLNVPLCSWQRDWHGDTIVNE